MSDEKEKETMCKHCPLGLKKYPDNICPLAVERLEALKELHGNSLLYKEEEMPGCEWAINDQKACCCFFKYVDQNELKKHSTAQTASLLRLSHQSVYASYNKGIERLQRSEKIKNLKPEE